MKWPFTLVLCPNCHHGDPHVGHLWYVMHVLHLRNWARRQSELYGWDMDVRLNVLFDVHSQPKYEDAFLHMLAWLGQHADSVDRLRDFGDWRRVMALQAMFHTGHWQDSVVKYWHFADFDPEGRAVKMLYFNAVGAYWHVRGEDLYVERLGDRQTLQTYPLRTPKMWYIPILHDENGVKIGGDHVPTHYLMPPLFDEKFPVVLRSLFGLFDANSVEDFYGPHFQPLHRHVNGRKLVVPPEWHVRVKTSEERVPGDEYDLVRGRAKGDSDT